MTNLQIVQASVQRDYFYEVGVNPLDVVTISEIEAADPAISGSQPGDFWITDDQIGRVVRVVGVEVVEIWCNY